MRMIIAVVLVVGCSNSARKELEESKIELADLAVRKFAMEAYPQWSMAHPTQPCPTSIDELTEYTNGKDAAIDPWKNPIKIFCGENVPEGVKGLGAMSFGPDGKENTADDIKSWEKRK